MSDRGKYFTFSLSYTALTRGRKLFLTNFSPILDDTLEEDQRTSRTVPSFDGIINFEHPLALRSMVCFEEVDVIGGYQSTAEISVL